MPQGLFVAVAAIFGLVFGSFANVVIWRFPRGESLSYPASHCPQCDTPIAPRDNIPVLSWLLLRGRCRACGNPISSRYPAVELLSGLLWAGAALAFGPTLRAGFAAAFLYLLLILAFIDLDTMRLPNGLVAALAGVGLAGSVFSQVSHVSAVPLVNFGSPLSSPLAASLVGCVTAGGIMLFVSVAYRLVRGKMGIGMGDVKLLAAMGLFLGPYALLAYFVATIFGALATLVISLRRQDVLKKRFPFGPALATGALIVAFVGPQLWSAYLRIVGL